MSPSSVTGQACVACQASAAGGRGCGCGTTPAVEHLHTNVGTWTARRRLQGLFQVGKSRLPPAATLVQAAGVLPDQLLRAAAR